MGDELISPQALCRLLDTAQPPTVIDVRDDAEYAAGHIPGARHIPAHQLAQQLGQIPHDRPVVPY